MTIAWRTPVASRIMPDARRVPACSRTKASTAACSRSTARAPMPFGTTWSTTTFASKRFARSRLIRIASSACGPPRTGTRIDRTWSRPRCLTTAMSHGDSRTTASMVGEKTARGSARSPARTISVASASARAACDGVGGPPQPKMTRSLLSSPTASITPSAAWRPMRTSVRSSTPSSSPKSSTRWSSRREVRAWVAPSERLTPSGHLDDAEGRDLGRPAVRHAGTDADEVARRSRVRERQEDAIRSPAPGRRHQLPAPSARADRHRATR